MPAANCSSTCCTITIAAGKSCGQIARGASPAPPGRRRRRRSRPADRGGDGERAIAACAAVPRRACRRPAARSSRSWPAAARHASRASPLPSSGVSTASSAPWPIASKTRLALTRTLPVTIRIAHGVLAMIRRVASTPSITGMIMSIRIRSGVSFAQSADRLGAVRAIQTTRLAGSTPHRRAAGARRPPRQIVDDADSHASGSPIRSTTACSSVSSWKLPLVR